MSKNANRFLYLYLFSYLVLNLLDYCPIEPENNLIDDIYYVVSSSLNVGVFYLVYLFGKNKISLRNNKEFRRVLIVILIYTAWALIVNILILIGVGSSETPFYSQVDIVIIILGILWNFASKR
jgi:cell shape-determining protein MreD